METAVRWIRSSLAWCRASTPKTNIPTIQGYGQLKKQHRNVASFDWRETIARRPVFTVDYWGLPAMAKEDLAEVTTDLEHMKAYADPVTVRSISHMFAMNRPTTKNPGWFAWPDLVHSTDEEIARWQDDLRTRMRPLLEQCREAGVQCLDLHALFLCSGGDSSPEWYHAVPDWEECDLSGRPLGSIDPSWSMACLAHPVLYEVIDRGFKAMEFLNDEPVFLGFHVENEPHLGNWRDLANFGGNPHTRRAFTEYLSTACGSVREFNETAGTEFDSLDSVDAGHPNWLVRTLACRFRSSLVTGVYQSRAAALAKRHFPRAVVMTRLETGEWLGEEKDGKEFAGVELTLLKDSEVDVISWSHLWDAQDPDGFGQLNVTGGLLRGLGKMIGFTEPHVQRYGDGQWSVFRPDELQHFIYRGLFYNFRMFNLHSWDRQGADAIYNEPFGAVYSKHRGTLRMVAQLRSELERIAPFETFGAPVRPPLALVVSRNARHYPGMGGWFYGNWLARLCKVLEDPRYSAYEVAEEQSSDVRRVLESSRGAMVIDACLSPSTRTLLDRFVRAGGKLLVLGAPSTVGSNYEPADLPDSYPVSPERWDLALIAGASPEAPEDCEVVFGHPVFSDIRVLRLAHPRPLSVRPSGSTLALSSDGIPVAAASEGVVYLGGFPVEIDVQRRLMAGFQRWCGVSETLVVVSAFENATVVQNWDTGNHRRDGTVIDGGPWTGSVRLHGPHIGLIEELREDHPWLAYHQDGGDIVLEAVGLDPKDVRVFRKRSARELPHLEGLPDALGFEYWWSGESHPVIGRFAASLPVYVEARIAGGPWDEDAIGWFVVEVGGATRAEGRGRSVRFSALPGKDYYLTAVLRDHPHREKCALCQDHAFE